jgi:hypothetical protein
MPASRSFRSRGATTSILDLATGLTTPPLIDDNDAGFNLGLGVDSVDLGFDRIPTVDLVRPTVDLFARFSREMIDVELRPDPVWVLFIDAVRLKRY